jgi:hypothetical protein
MPKAARHGLLRFDWSVLASKLANPPICILRRAILKELPIFH